MFSFVGGGGDGLYTSIIGTFDMNSEYFFLADMNSEYFFATFRVTR